MLAVWTRSITDEDKGERLDFRLADTAPLLGKAVVVKVLEGFGKYTPLLIKILHTRYKNGAGDPVHCMHAILNSRIYLTILRSASQVLKIYALARPVLLPPRPHG